MRKIKAHEFIEPSKLGCMELEAFIANPDVDPYKINYVFIGVGQAGGRMAIEYNRLGFYVVLINTCYEDNQQNENILKKIGNGKYKIITLTGSDGAKKDRLYGQHMVYKNLDNIENQLLNIEELKSAEFAFVLTSLDGGTGGGSTPMIINILSNYVYTGKKRIGYMAYDEDTSSPEIVDEGRAPIAVMASCPDLTRGHDMEANAGECLIELQDLQNQGHCGSICIIDNEKIKSDFMNTGDNSTVKWYTKGNTVQASILLEFSAITSMTGEQNHDKAELLDALSRPGYLIFSKEKLHKENSDSDKNDFNAVVKNLLENSSIFISDVDYTFTTAAGYALLYSNKKSGFKPIDELNFDSAFRKFFDTGKPLIHDGVYNNTYYGDYRKILSNNDSQGDQGQYGIIYSYAIVTQPPKRILNMIESAQQGMKEFEEIQSNSQRELNFSRSNSRSKNRQQNNSTNLKDLIGRPGAKPKVQKEAKRPIDMRERIKNHLG